MAVSLLDPESHVVYLGNESQNIIWGQDSKESSIYDLYPKSNVASVCQTQPRLGTFNRSMVNGTSEDKTNVKRKEETNLDHDAGCTRLSADVITGGDSV